MFLIDQINFQSISIADKIMAFVRRRESYGTGGKSPNRKANELSRIFGALIGVRRPKAKGKQTEIEGRL